MGWPSLIFRFIAGTIVSFFVFLVFYAIPSYLPELVSLAMPSQAEALKGIVSALVSPALPFIGLFLTVAVFLEIFLKDTEVYGPLLMLSGSGFIAYILVAMHGGIIQMVVPSNLLMGISLNLAVGLTFLMLIMLLPSALTVLKGLILTFKKRNPDGTAMK